MFQAETNSTNTCQKSLTTSLIEKLVNKNRSFETTSKNSRFPLCTERAAAMMKVRHFGCEQRLLFVMGFQYGCHTGRKVTLPCKLG